MSGPGMLKRCMLNRFIRKPLSDGGAVESHCAQPTGPFVVCVYDNFHFMDRDEAYDHGSYTTWNEAVAEAKRIVEMSLRDAVRGAGTADAIYRAYTAFGDNPAICPVPEGMHFSAWEYARERCDELGAQRANADRSHQR